MRTASTGGLLGLVGLALVVPAVAQAAGGAGHGSTSEAVLLLLFIGAAYLLTHFVVERLQKRFLVVSGLEYVLLGILLGPAVPQLHAFDDLTGLLPIIALAAGWIGLIRGMEIDLSHFRDAPKGAMRLALTVSTVSGTVILVGAWAFFTYAPIWRDPISQKGAWMSAGVLACCAVVGSTAPIDVVKQRYHVEGKAVPLLRRAARLGDFLALLVFGLLFCIFHRDAPGAPLLLRPTEWAVVSVALGVVLGLLFRPFVREDESDNARFLALVGIITFASGAAWFLNLSPLLVNLILGTTLVNSVASVPQIQATLERTDRPMSLVLLVLAGALWSVPPLWPTVAGFCGYVVLRMLGKAAGARLAAVGLEMRPDLHRGLMGHGVVTIAMAISFRLVYEGTAVDVAYSMILASVVFHDLAAPRVLRSLLVDAGDVRREQER